MKTFKLHTLGCKVNQYETQLMREQLLNSGLKEINSSVPADLYIINTCTVTSDADRESRRFIRHSIKENPCATIIAAGCYTEKDADVIKGIDENIIILHNKDKVKIGSAPNFSLPKFTEKLGADPIFITHFHGHTRAFIKIQDGCGNFCSYCKVPYVRGAPESRAKQDILKEAEELIKNGYKEIVLSGICLGAYGGDLSLQGGLADILAELQLLEGNFRLRLSSIEMKYITDELINLIKNSKKICHHLHIPLQSGDDGILKKMNRKYTQDEFIDKITQIRANIPYIAISTDVIVGFPGETEEAFKNTVKCIERVKPMRTHIFTYSPREGTAAFSLKPHIDRDTITTRYEILKEITDKLASDYAEIIKGMPQRILIESTRDKISKKLCGYTDSYIKMTFNGPDSWMDKFIYIATQD